MARVSLILGSESDREIGDKAEAILKEFGVEHEYEVFSAHRNPQALKDQIEASESEVFIAVAGLSAALPGFIAAHTLKPVIGVPKDAKCSETTPTRPINAYGSSKLMTEWMLRDLAAAGGPSYVALRYFNVAGCDPEGVIGQSTPKATLLIKVACEAAVGKRPGVSIFGTDYPTPDGTGLRDYIHVEDLASAHLDALTYLRQGGRSSTMNCGYGHGYSVREVLETVGRINGEALHIKEEPRRAGDPIAGLAHRGAPWRCGDFGGDA